METSAFEAYAQVVEMLYGDGAHELIAKASSEREKRQAQVALGGNVLGLTAGTAALWAASKNPALKRKTATPKNAGPVTSRALRFIKTPKGQARLIQVGAGGAVALQAANTAADVVGNVVLRREAKKPISKRGALRAVGNTVRNIERASANLDRATADLVGVSRNAKKVTGKANHAAGVAGLTVGSAVTAGGGYAGYKVGTRKKNPDVKVKKSSPDMADLNTGHDKKKVYLNRGTLTVMAAEKAAPVAIKGSQKTADITVRGTKAAATKAEPVLVDVARKFKEKVNKTWDGSPSSSSSSPASSSSTHAPDVVWEGEFSKFDSDKRQVFGWASIVEVNGEPVVDLQGDYITPDEIEKAAYAYVQKSRKGGDMHRRDGDQPFHASEMIESFVVTDEKKKILGLPDSMPTGWWCGFQVHDDDVWAKVKSGERTGFSIHGRGKRQEVA